MAVEVADDIVLSCKLNGQNLHVNAHLVFNEFMN